MSRKSSWGLLTHEEHSCVALRERHQAGAVIARSARGLPFGKGRSYGDVCLNPGGTLWETHGLDRFISLNLDTGVLQCEAGVLLGDIQRTMLTHGWMLPVTPGTQYVTVGGAIANDVHGKNHHALGTFGDHVLGIELLRSDGSVMTCSATSNPQMLRATISGLGLTGVILSATLRLRAVPSAWLLGETLAYASLDDFFALAEQSVNDWEYTVSWVDCLSGAQVRGLFFRARHATPEDVAGTTEKDLTELQKKPLTISVPIAPPFSPVNRLSLRLLNSAYFHRHRGRSGQRLMHYQPFFYPLDSIAQWNRLYGPKGFYQYQCVLPESESRSGVANLLAQIRNSGQGSFLAVLKTFAQREAAGMLSFPMAGATLALDFPNKGNSTLQLFDTLDDIVREAGGRLYAAKDARMPSAMFASGYPALADFARYRDPGISSAMSRRLMDY